MLFKTFSLCALILSGAASTVAQALQPGTYTITSVSAGPDANRESVLLRGSGPGQLAVIPDVRSSVIEGSDKWNLAPGQNGGFTIQSALFNGFLTVGPNDNALVVGTTEDLNQATSFAITPAGNGVYHIQVAAKDNLWTAQPATTLPLPVPDLKIFIQPANGGQDQLWKLTTA